MGLRLYADECLDGRITAGLRWRGVDVVTVADERLLGASDDQHMERTTVLGRVILTADEDFFVIVRDRFARNVIREHASHVTQFFFTDQLGRVSRTADGGAQTALKDVKALQR